MGFQSVATSLPSSLQIVPANVIGGMHRTFETVMGWQNMAVPSRFAIGNRELRRLTLRIREQPANLIVTVHHSLTTVVDGQVLCKRGLKALDTLLGENNDHSKRTREQFSSGTFEDIKNSASDLRQRTNGVHQQFRTLRTVLLDIHKDLDKINSEEERSTFLARLSRQMSKNVKNCEEVLQKVHRDLDEIENSLNLITHCWQKVESEAAYLQVNGDSRLAVERNTITLKEIKESFMTLGKYFEDYLEKMGQLYDGNIVHLTDSNKKYLMNSRDVNCTYLMSSLTKGRLE